jgi:hypothetical protein
MKNKKVAKKAVNNYFLLQKKMAIATHTSFGNGVMLRKYDSIDVRGIRIMKIYRTALQNLRIFLQIDLD